MKKIFQILKIFAVFFVAFLLAVLPRSLTVRLMNFCTNGKWSEKCIEAKKNYDRLIEREYLKRIEREYNKRYRE